MYGIKRSTYGMARQQAGITTLGAIILVVFVGMFAFAAIRLTPIYLNYMKVVGVIDGVYAEFDGQKATRQIIRKSLSRRFDVDSVGVITYRDVKVTLVDGGLEVKAEYDHTAPFIYNVSFTVHFNKTALIRR
ncbi:MAG: DUF4845 domain-containing protein [Woeseiaceae bacterium]|nr:DUF4845 domain-containing protein [Woeseiaceae bacterium]